MGHFGDAGGIGERKFYPRLVRVALLLNEVLAGCHGFGRDDANADDDAPSLVLPGGMGCYL